MSHRLSRFAPALGFAVALLSFSLPASASRVLTGLIGGDLTDPENNGDPENNVNYNATFSASEEPNFGGSEGAFNVFDNLTTGGGNNKWCCGDQNNFPVNPISIDATFSGPHKLTHFTLTSGNDTPERAPRVWKVQGSTDGVNFTDIFSQNDPANSVWGGNFDQTIEFDEGVDYPVQSASYTTFRFLTTATGLTTSARFQLDEIEYFDTPVPEPASLGCVAVAGFALLARRRHCAAR